MNLVENKTCQILSIDLFLLNRTFAYVLTRKDHRRAPDGSSKAVSCEWKQINQIFRN